MSDPRQIIYEKKCATAIKALSERNIRGEFHKTKEAAIESICGMIPAGSVVGMGGSVTIVESGLIDALRKLDIELLDRYAEGVTCERVYEMRVKGLTSDVFIASANAVTADGKIVNMDGYGNRVSAVIFGPEKVILMAGANKVVKDVQEGVDRIRNVAAPMNSVRFKVDTPCARGGFCDEKNCRPPNRICGQLTVIESSPVEGRITVVFAGEELGF